MLPVPRNRAKAEVNITCNVAGDNIAGTAQSWAAWEQTDAITATPSAASYSFAHGVAENIPAPTITGGTSPYTVTSLDGSLPTGFTLTGSTGRRGA